MHVRPSVIRSRADKRADMQEIARKELTTRGGGGIIAQLMRQLRPSGRECKQHSFSAAAKRKAEGGISEPRTAQ